MQRSLRLGTLFLLCGLAAAALVAAVVYSVGPTAVEAALDGSLPPHRIAVAAEALRGATLAAALAALLLVVPVSIWIGGFARRPLADLRIAMGRKGGPLPRSSGITEFNALAARLARIIEEHRQTVAPLVQARDDLAYLIDSVGEGILHTGANGRIIRANRTARAMLGLPGNVADQPVATLIRHPDLLGMIDAARRGRTVEPLELAVLERRILVVAHPIGEGSDRPLGAVAVLVDLTDLRRLEGVRRDFVANASHELKTPLTSIRGYAETLLAEDAMPADTRRQFLETIHDNADRLQHIVDDLLDLTRLESGGWRPDLQELDLAGVARDVWGGLRDKAERKKIRFAIEADDPATALADPVGVRQILSNLLDNAIRYTPADGRIAVRIAGVPGIRRPAAHRPSSAAGTHAGGPAPRGASGHDDRRWILTEVADTGIGIPRDSLGRVFERFYRVDPARSRAEGGTGLGLAIVKHLVETMGGDVLADSELGKGTTFRFWLPAPGPVPAARTPEETRVSA